jgi:hypothetical protein
MKTMHGHVRSIGRPRKVLMFVCRDKRVFAFKTTNQCTISSLTDYRCEPSFVTWPLKCHPTNPESHMIATSSHFSRWRSPEREPQIHEAFSVKVIEASQLAFTSRLYLNNSGQLVSQVLANELSHIFSQRVIVCDQFSFSSVSTKNFGSKIDPVMIVWAHVQPKRSQCKTGTDPLNVMNPKHIAIAKRNTEAKRLRFLDSPHDTPNKVCVRHHS